MSQADQQQWCRSGFDSSRLLKPEPKPPGLKARRHIEPEARPKPDIAPLHFSGALA
jgi:hypothetical protein